jgi:quercetin dioxygenase-like cupin family protein
MPKLVLVAFGLLHDVMGNLLSEVVASVMAQMSAMSVPTLLIATFAITLLQKASAGQDRQPAVQSQTLLRTSSSWDGEPFRSYPSGQPELSILKITLAPHTQLEWHSHPMPSAAYIVDGELTLERKKDGKKQRFTAGQAVSETVGTLHRGVVGSKPVVLIVFYAGSPGMPLTQHSSQ